MAKDLVYYFDNDFVRHELGEIQSDFNQSFVIDGTKDSCKVEVYSFDDNEIMPWTIVWHKATDTWWVVSHDKVERYNNENGTFLYKHYLQLLGAIELLNARDLTDCGFNAKKYTFREFFSRLISLSTFEFKGNGQWGFTQQSFDYNISEHTLVDYIKTFQNYTLLSAIREFCDGYNIAPKLIFTQEQDGDDYILDQALFDLVPKTGLPNVTPINMSYFTDSRETRTIDKNSYGTSIVSNAENVQSTAMKEYPLIGGMKLSSTSDEVYYGNAILRLPDKVANIEWLRMIIPIRIVAECYMNDDVNTKEVYVTDLYADNNEMNFDLFQNLMRLCAKRFYANIVDTKETDLYKNLLTYFNGVNDFINKAGSVTLRTGWRYNPYDPDLFVEPENKPEFYFPYISHREQATSPLPNYDGALVIADEDTRNCLKSPMGCISWKRGSNIISNFAFMQTYGHNPRCNLKSFASTDIEDSSYDNGYMFFEHVENVYGNEAKVQLFLGTIGTNANLSVETQTAQFKVKYLPMDDLKIKLDNSSITQNIQFYNQNGRLTDGNALSKQLLSYAKTVESDNITRFKTFYDITTIPQVGQIVVDNDKRYVISNISKNFMECESSVENGVSYFCQCEFTMSLETGVKSLMVNPNTNIRDYGIPQQYNVERKQLYRDFYELDFTVSEDSTTNWIVPIQDMLYFGFAPNVKNNHIAVMKITWHDGSTEKNYYYQLDTTAFMFKKNYIEIVNFQDNNIIAYSSQNIASGFDITRIFNGMTDTVNTPISYVKDDGTFESISIAVCDSEVLMSLYENYKAYEMQRTGMEYAKPLYNASKFISPYIYEGGFPMNEYTDWYEHRTFYKSMDNTTGYEFEIDLKTENMIPQDYDGPVSNIEVLVGYCNGQLSTNQEMVKATYERDGRYYFYIDLNIGTTTSGLNFVCQLYVRIKSGSLSGGAKGLCDFLIQEPNYNKDALEVPVFEYSCQIDDTNNVKVGENVMLNQEEDIMYIYSYGFVNKNIATELNFLNYVNEATNEPTAFYSSSIPLRRVHGTNIASFVYRNGKLYISLANSNVVDFDTKEQTLIGTRQTFDTTKDLVIYRYAIKSIPWVDDSFVTVEDYQCDLMFIIRNLDQANIVTTNGYQELELAINYYKVD